MQSCLTREFRNDCVDSIFNVKDSRPLHVVCRTSISIWLTLIICRNGRIVWVLCARKAADYYESYYYTITKTIILDCKIKCNFLFSFLFRNYKVRWKIQIVSEIFEARLLFLSYCSSLVLWNLHSKEEKRNLKYRLFTHWVRPWISRNLVKLWTVLLVLPFILPLNQSFLFLFSFSFCYIFFHLTFSLNGCFCINIIALIFKNKFEKFVKERKESWLLK